MAISLGHEIFALCEKNIIGEGIFDRDWNSYPVIEIEDLDSCTDKVDKFIEHVEKSL